MKDELTIEHVKKKFADLAVELKGKGEEEITARVMETFRSLSPDVNAPKIHIVKSEEFGTGFVLDLQEFGKWIEDNKLGPLTETFDTNGHNHHVHFNLTCEAYSIATDFDEEDASTAVLLYDKVGALMKTFIDRVDADSPALVSIVEEYDVEDRGVDLVIIAVNKGKSRALLDHLIQDGTAFTVGGPFGMPVKPIKM